MGQSGVDQSRPLLVNGQRRSSQDSFDDEGRSQPDFARQLFYKFVSMVRPAHMTAMLRRLGYCAVPQLIRSRVWNDHGPPVKEFPTSYLNGIRGITSIKVFTFHYIMAFTDFTFLPWATDERHHTFLALPIVRYFYAGFTSHIFFGIAGYLTSLRLFQLLDRNDSASHAKVLMSISGSLFRRAFRLYLPVAIITFLSTLYIYFGFYEQTRPFILDHEVLFPGIWNEEKPVQNNTFYEQFLFWAHEMYRLTNIMSEETFYPFHDQHLWSILSEMRASVHLYGCLVALCQCKRHVRLILLFVIAFIYFYWNRWETWVYILGAAVAQIDILLTEREEESRQPSLLPEKPRDASSFDILDMPISDETYKFIRYVGFFTAFYMLSFPIFGDNHFAPGYEYLKTWIPEWMDRKDKFYANIGTIILLFLLVRSNKDTSKWRKVLMSPIPQYLGTISFAMYLVHGPLLHVFGYMIPQRIWWFFGAQGKDVSNIAWIAPILVGWSISLVVSLWAADVWTREVESRCVALVKRLEVVCFKDK